MYGRVPFRAIMHYQGSNLSGVLRDHSVYATGARSAPVRTEDRAICGNYRVGFKGRSESREV